MSIDMTKSSKKSHSKADLVEWAEVGRRVRELRGLYITQEELARSIGVSQGHLSYMERGEKEIGAEILLRISRKFGKSLEWLLTGGE
jgi:transcriptional regulator with XRE-family HTH domain